MNKFENCTTREEIIKKILKEGGNLEASERFLQLGFIDESVKFYILYQQEEFLNNFRQQLACAEDIINSNKTAGGFMMQAGEDIKFASTQMTYAAEDMKQAANTIMLSR